MNTNEAAKRLAKTLGRRYEGYRDIVPAVIKSRDGSVHPNNRADMVLVAKHGISAALIAVYNDRAPNVAETPVWIGPSPRSPDEYMVIGVYRQEVTPVQSSSLGPYGAGEHAQNHQYPSESDPGVDPVLVYQPAWQPLKATADNTDLTVSVQSLIFNIDGVRTVFPGAELDMTSNVPGTASRTHKTLIYLDTSINTLATVDGTDVVTGGAIPADYPDCPRDGIPCAYVELDNGQTTIPQSDIEDARFTLWGRPATNPYGPFRWEWADSTERGAETDVNQDDVDNYRLGFQVDTNTVYRATATTPTWQIVAAGGVDITETAQGFSIVSGSTDQAKLVVEQYPGYSGDDFAINLMAYDDSGYSRIQAGYQYGNTIHFYGSNLLQDVSIYGSGYQLALGADVTIDQNVTASADMNVSSVSGQNLAVDISSLHSATTSKSTRYILARQTTDATPTELFILASSGRITIPNNSAGAFTAQIVARRADADNESAAYWYHGLIDNNSLTTALVSSVVEDDAIEDTPAWSVAITANDTNDALAITVTGESSKTIDWVAMVELTLVTG